jgi:A/G-specific adenine glycosylase
MNRDQKIKILQNELIKWYELNHRKFPWRSKLMNSYKYIIAEVLLQRTKAETVAKFFNGFIQKYPNWESINCATINSIENYLKPIGLY